MKYVSLHSHSTFSYGDGFGSPRKHVERVSELGMESLALTEHGNITSHVQFEQAANEIGVNPIFGLEAYTAAEDMRETKSTRKWHLTLLAMNQEGYRNLCRLVTRSWAEGFYQWPTIHGSWLQEHNEGLIVMSGCSDSKLACDLLGGKGREFGNEADAVKTLKSFKRMLGDRFYLETQQFPELDRTHLINQKYAEWSSKFDIPLVASSDCHYPQPTDSTMQTILHAASRNTGTVAAAEASWEYSIKLTYPTSDKMLLERLMATGLTRRQAEMGLASTAEIAQRCNAKLEKADNLKFPLPREFKNAEELAWDWLRKGWRYRLPYNPNMRANKKQYVDRLKYEMEMITQKGFLDYFLMLSDAVSWAKDAGISVGPARGSAAASLACYLWRITEIDPIPFPNMLFERFIDITRTDLPDIDLDFDDERRDELRQHLVELYGADRVGNVGTFTKYKGKNSLDDVGRVYTVPKYKIDAIKGYIIERSGADARSDETLGDTIETFPEVKKMMDEFPDLYNALRLEGNYKGMSVHAAGLVVSNNPITDSVAYYTRTSGGVTRQVLSVDKHDAEYMNLLKVDLLGLKTMGQVGHSLEMIGMSLDDMYALPLDLPEVIEAFRKNDVVGIFQFSGLATRIVNGDVKPDNFDELCDVNSLSRPGPLHSGTTNDYVNVKWGKAEPIHWHPAIDEIVKTTKYQIIYQEQILKIIKEIGGLPWAAVNDIRKVISKKKGEGEFGKKREQFVEGAMGNYGMTEKDANGVWARIVTAGQYAFNASHAISYSTLAYWQMWMKVHHPEAFYAGNLIKFKDNQYALLRDALEHDVPIKPPDLNKSGLSWSVVDGALAGGLSQINGVGPKIAETIIQDRNENGPFSEEKGNTVQRVKGVGKVMAEKIAKMAASEDPYEITKIDRIIAKVKKAIRKRVIPVRFPTHAAPQIGKAKKDSFVIFMGIPQALAPQDVIENERARTGRPEEEIRAELKDPHLSKKMYVVCMDDSPEQMFARFTRYAFPKFEDALWNHLRLKHDVVVVWGKRSQAYGNSMNVNGMVIIDPDNFDDDGNLLDTPHQEEEPA